MEKKEIKLDQNSVKKNETKNDQTSENAKKVDSENDKKNKDKQMKKKKTKKEKKKKVFDYFIIIIYKIRIIVMQRYLRISILIFNIAIVYRKSGKKRRGNEKMVMVPVQVARLKKNRIKRRIRKNSRVS